MNTAKKIIFITSTSYSGSTMLDLMLANDPAGFSCGEVSALFRPFRPHHINPQCNCQEPECQRWPQFLNKGEAHLYHSIFENDPGLDFIVDSSKMLTWVYDQTSYLKSQPYQVINVVIWKTPLEYAHSCLKRNNARRWQSRYRSYYSHCLDQLDDWISVSYAQLAQHPGPTLQHLCQKIGIPYFEGKELFWNRRHHSLFGSSSTKLHTLRTGTTAFDELKTQQIRSKIRQDTSKIAEIAHHRSIVYEPVDPANLPQQLVQAAQADRKLAELETSLAENRLRKRRKIRINPGWWYYVEKFRYWILRLRQVHLNQTVQLRPANASKVTQEEETQN